MAEYSVVSVCVHCIFGIHSYSFLMDIWAVSVSHPLCIHAGADGFSSDTDLSVSPEFLNADLPGYRILAWELCAVPPVLYICCPCLFICIISKKKSVYLILVLLYIICFFFFFWLLWRFSPYNWFWSVLLCVLLWFSLYFFCLASLGFLDLWIYFRIFFFFWFLIPPPLLSLGDSMYMHIRSLEAVPQLVALFFFSLCASFWDIYHYYVLNCTIFSSALSNQCFILSSVSSILDIVGTISIVQFTFLSYLLCFYLTCWTHTICYHHFNVLC